MKRKIFFLYGLTCALAFGTCACSKPSEPVSVQLNQAADKAMAGDWAGAEKITRQALKQEPDNVNTLMLRAMACNNLGASAEALDLALRAAQLAPKLFLAQYLKGMLLCKNGKYDLALSPLKEARSLRPGDTNTLILLAEASLNQKKYDAAAYCFSSLARLPEYKLTPYPWNGIGVSYAVRAPQKALKFLRQAERLAPADPVTALNLAVLYDTRLRQKAPAMAYYARFLQLSAGKAEFDAIRGSAELRLDSLKGR